MKNKLVKKSSLVTYKAMNLSKAEISQVLGITQEEVVEGFKYFGLYKERATAPKDYSITWENDLEETEKQVKQLLTTTN